MDCANAHNPFPLHRRSLEENEQMTDNKGGRPPVGPATFVRLRPDVLKRVDVIAADLGMTRAETIRRLVHAGIASGLLGDGEPDARP